MGGITSNPRITVQLLPAAIVDAFADRRDLILGQRSATGTALDGQLYQDVQVMTESEIRALFGEDELYNRIQSWRTGNGGYSPLDVIAKAPAGGATAATAVLAFTGPATTDGELTISLVDERKFKMVITVLSGETATQVGDKIAAAVAALTRPPFSAANVSGTVTFTASDVGSVGNSYGVKVTGAVPGVGVTVTGWAGGATDPTLTGVLDPIDGLRYTGVSWPEYWQASLSTIVDELEARFNASNAILDGVCFHGRSATFANAKSAVSTLNSQCLVVGGNSKLDGSVHKGPAILQPADWTMAYFAGVRARRLTPGAPIADFIVATSGPLDAFGGPSLASLPYFNTPLKQTPVTLPADLFSGQEQLELEGEGFTTFGVNSAINSMIMGPVVTTWTTDAAGNANISFAYLNYVDTGSVCREIIFNTLKSVYAQSRLTEGDLIPGRSMANAESIMAELLRIYRVLAAAGLTQAGRKAEKYFKDNTSVTVNLAQRSVTIAGPLPIVTQIGTINYALQLSFTLESGTQITF